MALLVSQQTVAAVAAAAALTATNLGAPPHVVAAAVAAAVHNCWRWTAPETAKVVSLLECDALTEPEAEGVEDPGLACGSPVEGKSCHASQELLLAAPMPPRGADYAEETTECFR